MNDWLLDVVTSFDASDVFAFLGGVVFMICWKNVVAIMINKDGTKRHIDLPKMNAKVLTWAVVLITMLGILWATMETSAAQRDQAKQTKAIAERVCQDQKVASVERKALQDLFLNAFQIPDNIKNLSADDPARKKWGQEVILKYLGTLEDAGKQRTAVSLGGQVDPKFWGRYYAPTVPEPVCNHGVQ